jgi:VanZ family protein
LNGGSKINNIFIVEIRADYLIHVALYLPIGFLARAYFQNNARSSFKFILVSGIGSLAFASGMEYAQFFTTWRSFNINDLIANNIGVTLSYALLLAFK